jgi:hypothetical protein
MVYPPTLMKGGFGWGISSTSKRGMDGETSELKTLSGRNNHDASLKSDRLSRSAGSINKNLGGFYPAAANEEELRSMSRRNELARCGGPNGI